MHIPQTDVILRHEGAELARVTLPPGEYVIGRSPEVEIHANTPLISRRHSLLTINYDHLLLEDLGSSTGTFINDQPVTEATRLFPNQSIRLGDVQLEVRRQRASTQPGVSLAPAQAAIRRFLPDELLAEKRYAVGNVVAQGGMGAILAARQTALDRNIAMKVMLETSDEGDVLRFIDEAKITGQLDHPNIVPIYELGVDEQDQLFYTMKMVRGITLKKVLALLDQGVEATVKKYPLTALLTIFQKVCDAIAFAHSRGVIHRDLKPENIMLGDFGSVLVMDWGLAKVLAGRDGSPSRPPAASQRSLVMSARTAEPQIGSTLAGSIMGTPQYMAPEQARGEVETLDARADIYSLGAILFELLHLRPAVTGLDPMAIVEKVAAGGIEWDTKKNTRLPDSLLAVCRKALAFDKAQRYASVEDLQRDLTAYQAGFATGAEKAGGWKQFTLLVKRHKATSIGIAAVLVVGATLGTKAIVEGRRAAREAVRANAALAELKKSAPALLQLAESEADSQRFDRALAKVDAALVLDPSLLRAWWQRAWVLLGLERWSDAANALRLARQHDPAGAKLASILPAVEKMDAASAKERWKGDAAREVFGHLESVGATGPVLAFGAKLRLSSEERRKLVEQRLSSTLGKGNFVVTVGNDGMVRVNIDGRPIRSLEPLRGLPLDNLNARQTLIADLEPLHGIPLQLLDIYATKVTDLAALQGMPLRSIMLSTTSVSDLSPLKGMKLRYFNIGSNREITNLSALAGMPLNEIDIHATGIVLIDVLRGMPLTKLTANLCSAVKDWSPLKGAPLESLNLADTKVSDLSFVQGMPLHVLDLANTPVMNLAPLRGLPLESLSLDRAPVTGLSVLRGMALKVLRLRYCKNIADYSPVLTLPLLEVFHCDALPKELLPLRASKTLQIIEAFAYPGEGYVGERPVAEFWRAYDAHQKEAAPK